MMLKVMPTAKATWVPIAIAALLLAVLLASVSYTITLGPLPVTSGQVWGVVAHHLGIGSMPDGVSELQAAAVWRVRVPRALLAALEPYGVREIVKSGAIGIGRGSRSITDRALDRVSRSA